MNPTYVIVGRLTREFILPPLGTPLLDAAGGSLLYAAGGLRLWDESIGLVARLGEDYPRAWVRGLQKQGFDTQGIRVLPQSIDQRSFLSYSEEFEIIRGTPVSQFARRGLSFPKVLLGYQNPERARIDPKEPDLLSPLPVEIPAEYREARAVHLCPLDFVSHSQLVSVFKASAIPTVALDPSPAYMSPTFLKDLRVVLDGLTAFLPSEEELRELFWGETHDLWEMAEALGGFGCEFVVIKCGGHGQLVYDAVGKHKWEVPAYPARVADPTGAGDAFCGGFLAGYKKAYDPLQAALHGNVAASLKVEGSGALYPLTVLPGLAEARLNALQDLVNEV